MVDEGESTRLFWVVGHLARIDPTLR